MEKGHLAISQIAYWIWRLRGGQPSTHDQELGDWHAAVTVYNTAIQDGVPFVYIGIDGKIVKVLVNG